MGSFVAGMLPLTVGPFTTQVLQGFIVDIQAALPKIIAGVLFLLISAVAIYVGRKMLRTALLRLLPGTPAIYRQFLITVIWIFAWFGVGLTFLSIVGLGEIAAALGTATGFLALGISYALSGMIADTVAGMYLLRDPDFNAGDVVTVGDETGTIQSIELRKTRFDVEGDTVVRGNAEIEQRWTRRAEGN